MSHNQIGTVNGDGTFNPYGSTVGDTVSANNVTYDNTSSGLTATDVQDALTELNSNKADVGTGQIAGTVVFGKEKFSNTYNTGFFVQLNGKTPTLTLCRLYTANGLIDVTAATSLYVEDYCVSLLCSDDRSSGQAAYVVFTVS